MQYVIGRVFSRTIAFVLLTYAYSDEICIFIYFKLVY